MKINPKKAEIKNILAEKFTFAKACGLSVVLGGAVLVSGLNQERKVNKYDADGALQPSTTMTFTDVVGTLVAGLGAAGLMLDGYSKAGKKNETNLLDHMPKGRGAR